MNDRLYARTRIKDFMSLGPTSPSRPMMPDRVYISRFEPTNQGGIVDMCVRALKSCKTFWLRDVFRFARVYR